MTYQTWFFSLFVVYIREINGCTAFIEWYTFSTTSYFLEKCNKFRKAIKTRKKSFNSFFQKLENDDSFKSYKGLKLNVEKDLFLRLKLKNDDSFKNYKGLKLNVKKA